MAEHSPGKPDTSSATITLTQHSPSTPQPALVNDRKTPTTPNNQPDSPSSSINEVCPSAKDVGAPTPTPAIVDDEPDDGQEGPIQHMINWLCDSAEAVSLPCECSCRFCGGFATKSPKLCNTCLWRCWGVDIEEDDEEVEDGREVAVDAGWRVEGNKSSAWQVGTGENWFEMVLE